MRDTGEMGWGGFLKLVANFFTVLSWYELSATCCFSFFLFLGSIICWFALRIASSFSKFVHTFGRCILFLGSYFAEVWMLFNHQMKCWDKYTNKFGIFSLSLMNYSLSFDLQAFNHFALSCVSSYPSCISHRLVICLLGLPFFSLLCLLDSSSCLFFLFHLILILWYRYASFLAIESGSSSRNQQCLTYWVLFSLTKILEWSLLKLLEW